MNEAAERIEEVIEQRKKLISKTKKESKKMNNKKLKDLIEQLKEVTEELRNAETHGAEEKEEEKKAVIEAAEVCAEVAEVSSNPQETEKVNVAAQTDENISTFAATNPTEEKIVPYRSELDESKGQYFKTIFRGKEVAYGDRFVLLNEESFTVEVDYFGLLESYGKQQNEVDKIILEIWGRKRMIHFNYDLYRPDTDEFIGSFIGINNIYSIDLTSIYKKYGDASFKFVAKWHPEDSEILSLDVIKVIDPYPVRLEISEPPKKTSYTEGSFFNTNGMKVNLVYSTGLTKQITDYTVSPVKNLTLSDSRITVKYENFQVKQPITVTAHSENIYEEVKEVKSFSLLKNVTFQYELISKNSTLIFNDVSADSSLLKLNLAHVFRKGMPLTVNGNHFSININESISGNYYNDYLLNVYQIKDSSAKDLIFTQTAPPAVENLPVYKYYKEDCNSETEKEKCMPVKWIIDGTVIRGFNKAGELVMLSDTCGNYYEILYDNSGRISVVNDCRYKLAFRNYNFNYKEDRLSSITYNKSTLTDRLAVNYTYEEGNLKTITYPSGESLVLSYLNGNIYQIESSDGYLVEISYRGADVKITLKSTLNKIPDGETDYNLPIIKEWQIISSDGVTCITYDSRDKEYYKIHSDGYVSGYYTEQGDVVVSAEEYDYIPHLRKITNYAKRSALFTEPFSEFIFEGGEKEEVFLDERNRVTREERTNIPVTDNKTATSWTEYFYDERGRLMEKDNHIIFSHDGKENLITETYTYDEQDLLISKCSHIYEMDERGDTVTEFEYDTFGNVTKKTTYNTLNPDEKIVEQTTYNSLGKIEYVYDELGLNKTVYVYNNSTKNLSFVQLPEGNLIEYSYDNADRVTKVSVSDSNQTAENTITYNCDEVTELTGGSEKLSFLYDGERRLKNTIVGSSVYESYEYETRDESGNRLDKISVKMTGGNGSVYKTEKTYSTHTVKTSFDSSSAELVYNADGSIKQIADGVTGETATFAYNNSGQLKGYTVKKDGVNVYAERMGYNGYGNLSQLNQKGTTDICYKYDYSFDALNELLTTEINSAGGTNICKISPHKDALGRNIGRTIKKGDKDLLNESIGYSNLDGRTRTVPSSVNLKVNGNTMYYYSYSYDKNGNITSVSKSGSRQSEYVYDMFGRLVLEKNWKKSLAYQFTYDASGNMIKRVISRLLNSGEIEQTMPLDTMKLQYDNGKLALFNVGKTENYFIFYDAAGNPWQYRKKRLTWKGKLLKSFGNYIFEYDGRGRRIKKNDTEYYYDSEDRLVASSDGMEYFYDHIGVAGFRYNNKTYFYLRDMLNNITGIIDSNGIRVVEYEYDAWGNHTVSGIYTDLGKINPFRYRSYFYDTETQLYYLKSRYYDPYIGRFISMDSVDYADPETVGGLNLYAYCYNNPVMYVDENGTLPNWAKWLIASVATVALVVAAVALTVTTGGVVAAIVTGAAVNATLSLAQQKETEEIDLGQFIIDTTVGAASGFIGYGVGQVASEVGKFIGAGIEQMSIKGLQVGKVFTGNIIPEIGKGTGKILGAFFSGLFIDKSVNGVFNTSSLQSRISNNLTGSGFSLVLDFLRFIW